jgi:hypothetical protein
MSRPGIEPGPPAREASTLEKSRLDSLYAGYSEPLFSLRAILYITYLSYSTRGVGSIVHIGHWRTKQFG